MPMCTELILSAPLPTHHRLFDSESMPRVEVVVDDQQDILSAFTHEKKKNRSELRHRSNTESWLGITFLSFFLPPSCPLTIPLPRFCCLSCLQTQIGRNWLPKKPTGHSFFTDWRTHKVPAVCGKV